MLVTLPLDFMGRIIKLFLIGQLLLVKYKINQEFRYSCTAVHSWVNQKTSGISVINSVYNKIIGYIYDFATKDLQVPPQQQ
jgi:hypothetical protein